MDEVRVETEDSGALHSQAAQAESLQRQEEISALLAASRAILSYREFEPAARVIFDECKRLTGATAGYVALLSSDGSENDVLFLDPGDVACTVEPSLPMPIRGLRESVYRTGQTVYENDFPGTDWVEFIPPGHASINNVLFAPLAINGIVVGLLGLANKPGGFSESDVHLASAFGELAAIALLNSRTLEALQNSEERYRAVAQTASDAIITVDSCGTIVFWNNTAEAMFGYASTEAVGQPLAFVMPERFRTAHQSGMERLVSTGKPRILGNTVEMVGSRRNGTEFPVELSLSTWKIKENTFFTGIIRDITARKRAEEEITSLARFPSENRNPVLRVSPDGTIRYANAASAPLLATWGTEVDRKLPDPLRELMSDAIGRNTSHTTEVTDGERVFSLDLAPVPEESYVNFYGRDVTEQVWAEAALREQNEFIVDAIEALNHPFYVIGADDYMIKIANSAAYGGEFPEQATCYALTHRQNAPCEGHQHPCPLKEIQKTRKPVVVEHVHYNPEGERRCYEVHGHPVFDGDGNVTQIIEYTLDITDRKQVEEALRERTQELGERIKELNCLYGISALVEKPGIALAEILQGTVNLIPPAWQYPEITSARITLDGQEIQTLGFPEIPTWHQAADIMVFGEPVGLVEVCYREERPAGAEGPFMKEERSLLNAIAERLGKIIARIRTEDALRDSEEKWRSLTEYSPDFIMLLDKDANIRFINHTLPGLTEDQVVGTSFFDYALPQYRQPTKECFERVLHTGNPDRFESVYHDNGDTRQYFESHVGPVRSGDQVVGLTVSSRDITDRVRAEQALQRAHDELELRVQQRTAELAQANQGLRAEMTQHKQTTATLQESEERYRRLVEVAFEAIAIHRAGKIVYINPAGAQLLGARNPTELIDMAIADFVPSEHWDMVQSRLLQAREAGTGVPLTEERLMRLDGTNVEVEIAAIASTFQGQPAVQIVIHDLTERRRAEREREQERQRIARDLHDSLGHSLGYLRLKLDQFACSEELGDVTELRQEVVQMCDVADQAYEMVRGMLATLHPSNADDLPTTLLALARAAGQRADFKAQLSSEGPASALHPVVQQQILYLFQEALNNVAKHAGAQQVDIGLSWTEDALTATLADDGCGFDVVNLQRAPGHYGLRIMQERAEEINGQLTFNSRPGCGTQLLLRLPLTPSRQRETE